MSGDGQVQAPQGDGNQPDDFWEEEDSRRKMVEHLVEANQLGGYSDKFKDLDVLEGDDDEDQGEGGKDATEDEDEGESDSD
jgi:hypothetical protein